MATPTISISNAVVTPSPTGMTQATFTVTLSAPSATDTVLNYATLQGTASSGGGDYTGIPNGTLVIPAGKTSGTIEVSIKPHAAGSAPKTFTVQLTQPAIIKPLGICTIQPPPATHNEPPPVVVPPVPPVIPPVITVGASPITKGGTYDSITATTVVANDSQPLILNNCVFDTFVGNKACDITLTKNKITGANPTSEYASVVWNFDNYRAENNEVHGAGMLVQNANGKALTAISRYNVGIDIAGPRGIKRSFIQHFKLKIGGKLPDGTPAMAIDWNYTDGGVGMEDVYSYCLTRGLATNYATMSHNFCGRNQANPPLSAPGQSFSGSIFMLADPGGDENITEGNFIEAIGNVGCNCDAGGLVIAYGFGYRVFDNLLVKDSGFGSTPVLIENWGLHSPATPANLYLTQTQIARNQVCWHVNGKLVMPSIPAIVDQSAGPNIQVSMTEAQAKAKWLADAAAANVKVGRQ